jgi:hypothetical protein
MPLWAATAADQTFFAVGRSFRNHRRVRTVAAKPAFAKAMVMLERHPILLMIGFRFLYGSATRIEAVRRAIQHSQESLGGLAKRLAGRIIAVLRSAR